MNERLHPAPNVSDVDYIWYASRIRAMTNISELYGPEGWTELSQKCFKWLATVPGQKLPFKILAIKGEKS